MLTWVLALPLAVLGGWFAATRVSDRSGVRATAAVDRPAPAGFDRQTVARLLSVYEDVKTERGVIDFEDVLLMLGDMLDPQRLEADVTDGVLTLRIPVAETATPRKVEVGTGAGHGAEQAALSA